MELQHDTHISSTSVNSTGVSVPVWQGRAIMLLDLDAFFASVEQLDHPEWRGKPVIVGGSADKRGVVSTCSYEARSFGVRSAMPAVTARKLCPDAIWTSGNFARYKEMSNAVMRIMLRESPFLQQVSIDEAFMDVSPTRFAQENPVAIAQRIQQAVDKLGISCSIGLGPSKSVAKVASEIDKPHGLTVVYPGRERDFLAPLPCKVMSGIGPVAQRKLAEMGIQTLGDIAKADPLLLKPVFGKNVQMVQKRCLGSDSDSVTEGKSAKSISNEMSFAEDLTTRKDIEAALATIAAKVARRLRRKQVFATSLSLKVRYADRSVRSVQEPLKLPSNNEYDFITHLNTMIDILWVQGMSVRLLGMAAFGLVDSESTYSAHMVQASLFDVEQEAFEVNQEDRKTQTNLIATADRIRERFGEAALRFGREVRTYDNLTGSSSKNPEDYKD